MNSRRETLEQLAGLILKVEKPHPVRVAIDGVDAAGKTMLADELAPLIEGYGKPVIRASIDGFHNPKAIRYRRGADSPQGYYHDSFNHQAILRELLIPLGPGGNRKYHRKAFDYRVDAPNLGPNFETPLDSILLFDGVFLLRPELVEYWDYSIFVDVDFDVSVPRAVSREITRNDGHMEIETVRAKYNQRYVPGQQIYLEEAGPKERAGVIMDNNDLSTPMLVIEG